MAGRGEGRGAGRAGRAGSGRGFGAFAAAHGIKFEHDSGIQPANSRGAGRGRGGFSVLDRVIASNSTPRKEQPQPQKPPRSSVDPQLQQHVEMLADKFGMIKGARSTIVRESKGKAKGWILSNGKTVQQARADMDYRVCPGRSDFSPPVPPPAAPAEAPAMDAIVQGTRGIALEAEAHKHKPSSVASAIKPDPVAASAPAAANSTGGMSWGARGALKAELRKIKVSKDSYVASELRQCDAEGFMAAGALLWASVAPHRTEASASRKSGSLPQPLTNGDSHFDGQVAVLMALEQRKPGEPPLLNFIGGKRDALGESARQTAVREVTEETGGLVSEATRAAILAASGPVLWDSNGKYATLVVQASAEEYDLPHRLRTRGGPPDPGDESLMGVRWVALADVLSDAWCKKHMAAHHYHPLKLLWPHLRELHKRVEGGSVEEQQVSVS